MTFTEAQEHVGKYVFNTITYNPPMFVPKGDRWLVKDAKGNDVVVIHAPRRGQSAGQMTLTQRHLEHFTTREP